MMPFGKNDDRPGSARPTPYVIMRRQTLPGQETRPKLAEAMPQSPVADTGQQGAQQAAQTAYLARMEFNLDQQLTTLAGQYTDDPAGFQISSQKSREKFLEQIQDHHQRQRAATAFDLKAQKHQGQIEHHHRQAVIQQNELDLRTAGDHFLNQANQAIRSEARDEAIEAFDKYTTTLTALLENGSIDPKQRIAMRNQASDALLMQRIQGNFERALATGGLEGGRHYAESLQDDPTVPVYLQHSLTSRLGEQISTAEKELIKSAAIQRVIKTLYNQEHTQEQSGEHDHDHFDSYSPADRKAASQVWSTEQKLLKDQNAPLEMINTRLLNYVDRLGFVSESQGKYIRALASGTPDQKASAADLLKRINRLPGERIGKQLSSDQKGYLMLIADMLEAGQTPENAEKRADRMVKPQNQAEREARKIAFQEIEPITREDMIDHFDDLFSDPDLYDDSVEKLLSRANGIFERQFLFTGDQDVAKEYALSQIEKTYGVSEIDGHKRLMEYPPEAIYAIDGDNQWMRDQWLGDLEAYQKQGLIPKDVDLDQDVVLVADDTTGRLIKSHHPVSWLIQVYGKDGKPEAIKGPNGRPLRWYPDQEREWEARVSGMGKRREKLRETVRIVSGRIDRLKKTAKKDPSENNVQIIDEGPSENNVRIIDEGSSENNVRIIDQVPEFLGRPAPIPGVVGPEKPEPPPVSFSELWLNYYKMEDPLVAAFFKARDIHHQQRLAQKYFGGINPHFNPAEHLNGHYRAFMEEFILANSIEEVNTIKRQIDQELETRRYLDNAGWRGDVVGVVGSVFNTANLFPGGMIFRSIRLGSSALQAATRTAAAAALSATASEAILHSTQRTRTLQESAFNITIDTLFNATMASFSPLIRQSVEKRALGKAYDTIAKKPLGPADDPLVTLKPSEIERVIAERGPAFEKDGILTFKGRGYGLVKVLIKHGKLSKKQPEHQITRSDVTYLPTVLRTYEPTEVKGKPGEARYARSYRIQRGKKTVVYAVSRFSQEDGADRLVTIHVEEPRPQGPMSKRKKADWAGSSGRIISPPEDTAGAASYHHSQGQPSQQKK